LDYEVLDMIGKFYDWIVNKGTNFFRSFVQHSDSIEQVRRVYLLIFLSLIGVINLIPLGILALYQKNPVLGIADLAVAAILILNLVNARGKKTFDANIYIGISFTAVLYIFLYMTGGINNSGAVWYYTFPLISSYLLGSTRGALASTLILFPVVAQSFILFPKPFFTQYSPDF
jgi:hypothetical protein